MSCRERLGRIFIKNKEIKAILPIIVNEVDILSKNENDLSFENILKLAMNYLDKDSSNLARWRSIIE